MIHSIDSVDLLRTVDEAVAEKGRHVEVLIQVDLARESTKHGAPESEVPAIIEAALGCRALRLSGLMMLPPAVADPADARPYFAAVRDLRERYVAQGVPAANLTELSMGMSHDFEVAIEEGATMVRVGSEIFGARSYGTT